MMRAFIKSIAVGFALMVGVVLSPSAFASIVVTGQDNGLVTSPAVVSATADTLTFNWSYHTDDVDGPFYDPAGYFVDAVFFQLTNNGGADDQAGTISFSVLAGQSYGFYVSSIDDIGGGATIEATQVPEPGTLALFGLATLALGIARKRKQA